jgi:hypothetical protein
MSLRLRMLFAMLGVAMLIAPRQSAPSAEPQVADIVVTAAPLYNPLAELRGEERFPRGAQLLRIHQGKAEPLLPEFAASADADLSFDGSALLFAGRRTARDPWQIWELNLSDRSLRLVVTSATDAERPFYLPGNRLVWAQQTGHRFELRSSGDGRPLNIVVLNPTAGPGILPLTYLTSSTFPAGVLRDGRILFEAGYPLGSGSTPELYLVYADGSGVESYRCDHGRPRWGGRQLASGDVVFTHGPSLARFTSAFAHEVPVAAPRGDFAGGIAQTSSGDWLVSVRSAPGTAFALKSWRPGATALRTVLALSGRNLVDPIVLAPRPRPRRHPSGLHPWDYANLMAMDARLSRSGDLKTAPARVRLETLDAKGRAVVTGTAPVESDGSFFVQVPGDRPIRLALLDSRGNIVRREQGWFWARGGEQRICVGCHTGPERAAENRVPQVLLRSTTPVDLTGFKSNAAPDAARGGH